MASFELHDPASAPEASKPLLEHSVKTFGMIPNLHAVMAESPQVLEAYQRLHELSHANSLTGPETDVVWLTTNLLHNCHYCVPAHTAIAKMKKTDDALIEELRAGGALSDPKLEALRQFVRAVVIKRGEVSKSELDAFFAAGFTKANYLDVILSVTEKILANYINHVVKTPIDDAFAKFLWDPAPSQPARAGDAPVAAE